MKNKKCLISLVALVLLLIIGLVSVLAVKGYRISIGRYLEAKNGTAMLISDNSPIQMSNRTEKGLFDNVDIGDKVLVIHDGIAETYPARTGVYIIFKLSDGTTNDIPQEVVNQLIELGWLEREQQSSSNEQVLYKVGESDLQRVYSYRASDSVVKPSILLFEGNRFQFTFSAASSYLGIGTYTINDNILVLNTDDGEYTYTFEVEMEGDVINRLIFDAENSSEYIHLGDFEDGAVFE